MGEMDDDKYSSRKKGVDGMSSICRKEGRDG